MAHFYGHARMSHACAGFTERDEHSCAGYWHGCLHDLVARRLKHRPHKWDKLHIIAVYAYNTKRNSFLYTVHFSTH